MVFKKVFFVLLFVFLVSCVHTEEATRSQTFKVPKERVWEVLIAVLKSYPLKTIDEQRGYIETEVLKADRFWLAPHQKRKDFSGYSAVLMATLDYEKPYSKVFIHKEVYRQKGFISSKEEVPSDLLEENILLYRLARELSIRSLLDKM